MAITTMNRCQMTIDCFAQIIDNDFVSEFIIVDDASTDGSAEILKAFFKDNPKVKVYVNKENLNMSRNKELAIRLCKESFVLIADSDNVFGNDYIDALKTIEVNNYDKHFLMPSFAKTEFDYRNFAGKMIHSGKMKRLMNEPMFEQLLNTCNMVVNRKKYLEVYEYNPTVKEVDTLWMNYLWLKNGGYFYVVPNMEYIHNVHSGSAWLSNARENIKKAEEIKKLILQLSE